ncbi:wall-associated receptor kinase-like 5 isoform X2 [Chenopodium quinoa]|uniref:wall-associated receptor kinase-like 5 isoform X2 n=1 Tax=Chenopodium quinoa TaxID=63459 RepID=UPI000B76EA56|nr:wall-associated receptor kinase-like 5 isoform X2 [Chenopodium quinoa]
MKMLSSYPLLLMSIIISSCLWRPSELRKHKDDCIHRCGNINIPYPFGIGLDTARNCFRDPNFAVSCNSSSSSQPKPFLKKLNLEILEVILYPYEVGDVVTVKIPSFTTCSSRNDRTVTSHNLANSPFKYSVTENVFVSVGCDGYALLLNETGGIVAGCATVCTLQPPAAVLRENRCIGYGCCQAQFMNHYTEIKKYSISVSTNNISGNCRSAFLISKEYLEANASLSSAIASVPVVLEWGSGYTTDESHDSAVGISLIICGSCWGCWRFKTKKRRKEIRLRAKYFKDKLEVQGSSNSDVREKTKLFTLTELKRYTDNFSKDRVLGQGGQGTVYKGMLKDGQVIAVKRSRALDESQWKQFINEVILLSQIKHRHVVKILGCCFEDDIPLVVYELICNGTLSEHIQKPVGEIIFTWKMRLNIAFETATAIAYLHSEFSTPIYHRDIKSSNILLDDKFGAKLSDFGISRAVSVEQTHLTTCVQGTFGYLDPEYFYSGQYSEKSDVYSFGVILVELLTGQKPIRALGPIDKDEEERSLAMYFVSSMNDNTLFEILDPLVLEGSKKEDVVEFANLAKQCLYPTGLERPTMKEVTMVLERLRYRNSSCTRPLTPVDQTKGLTTRISSMITSSMETDNAFLRSVTYDHIDLTTNSDSADVEMHLLHTC